MTKQRAASRKLLGWSILWGYAFAVYVSAHLYLDGAGMLLSLLAFPFLGSAVTLALCGVIYFGEQLFAAGRADRQGALEFVLQDHEQDLHRPAPYR